MKTTDPLVRLYKKSAISAVLGLVLISLVIGVVAVSTLYRTHVAQSEQAFQRFGAAIDDQVQQQIDGFRNVASQIASRTKARNTLIEYNTGVTDLETARRVIGDILSDVPRRSSLVLGVMRFGAKGELVAQAGQGATTDTLRSFTLSHNGFRHYLLNDGNGPPVFVVDAPIKDRENRWVGNDVVLFTSDEIRNTIEAAAHRFAGSRVVLNYPGEHGVTPVFASGPDMRGFDTAALASLDFVAKPSALGIAIQIPYARLHAAANTQLRRMTLVLLGILLLGCTGIYLLSRRFLATVGHEIDLRETRELELRQSEQRFRALVEGSPLPMLVVDDSPDSNISLVNTRFTELFGYTKDDIWDVNSWLPLAYPDPEHRRQVQEEWQKALEAMRASGATSIQPVSTDVTCADGIQRHVETSMSLMPGCGLVVFNDLTECKEAEELAELRQALAEMVYTGSEQDQLMRTALDAAEAMTRSKIGFFHFVEKDQETVSLQVWSTRTLTNMCYAEGAGLHYPVSSAGVWVDCIRQRRPVIHNDYPSLPHKKGLPEGHAPLQRELTVPLFRENRIVAVVGVGNKASEYNDHDLAIVSQVADMAFDFAERKRSEQQIQFMAYNDVLTGLPNRQLFADRFRHAASTTRRSNSLLAVCYLDLDGFKPVNDRYGHTTGDKVLVRLAERLKDELREGDTLARLGGDEFAILLIGLGNIYHGEEVIQRVLDAASQPFDVEGIRIHLSASIGATFFPHDDVDSDTLLRHADQAMYKAKESGKNTYRLFDPIENQKVHDYRNAIRDFENALDEPQLLLHYQPRIDLQSGELDSVEALVRWQHPERGFLPPGEFLPLIAGTPQEIALDEWVMQTALEQHMRWREKGLALPVSVNVSPRHIQQSSFPEFLESLLARYPRDVAQYLELEVLETSAIGDTAQVADIMNACAALGVRFSLDDFGTGYSSLTYFHRLPISVVKIDQNFVRCMLTDTRDQDIVEGVVRLADALKRPVVAEGVETIELGLMLLQLGCQYAQGYGIARPMPAEALLEWIDEWSKTPVWRQLRGKTVGVTEFYDLNVAIFSHRNWLQRVIEHIKSGLTSELPNMDVNACQFGHWYRGIGAARFGAHPQYAFIQARHSAVHELANKLVTLAEEQGTEKAEARLDELERLCGEMVSMLKQLAEPRG